MTHENHENCVKQNIMKAIEEGKLEMKPKWHFALKTSLAVLGGLVVGLVLLYLVSFIIFVMWYTGAWFVPVYGIRGILSFLLAAPWLLVAIVVIFLWILEILFRHYSFAYRRPLLYSTLGVLGLVMVGGFTVAQTSIHEVLLEKAREDRLPLAGPLYKRFGLQSIHDIHRGMISQIVEDGFVISNRRQEDLEIELTSKTRLPYGADFETGDFVVIFGERDEDHIIAYGVQKVGRDRNLIAATSSQQMRIHFVPRKEL